MRTTVTVKYRYRGSIIATPGHEWSAAEWREYRRQARQQRNEFQFYWLDAQGNWQDVI